MVLDVNPVSSTSSEQGAADEESNKERKVLSRVVGSTATMTDENGSSSTHHQLRLAMLSCENKPPYGPSEHTAELLLDLISMAATAQNDRLRWSIHISIFNAQAGDYPSSDEWDDYDGFLIPGSFSSAYDTDPWIERLKQVIQTHLVAHHRRILAICFGHQILAHSFPDGNATKVPTGARVGRQVMNMTQAGYLLLQKDCMDLYFTHGDMVEKLPEEIAVCLGGNETVPIQSAAYFDRAHQDVLHFFANHEHDGGTEAMSTFVPPPRPFAISFQAHPEYATSLKLGVEGTLDPCMNAMERAGSVELDVRAQASRDAHQQFDVVQQNSVHAMVQAGELLGWFPTFSIEEEKVKDDAKYS